MKSRGALRGMFAGALALALATVPAVSATADTTDGNWWFDYYNVGQAHADGWTGKGVKVAVIDTQINPDLPVFSGTELTVDKTAYCGGSPTSAEVSSDSSHGSTVTALLVGNGTGAGSIRGMAPETDTTFFGYGTSGCIDSGSGEATLGGFGRALQAAVKGGNQIVTTSVLFDRLSTGDLAVLADALAHGVIVVSGGGNTLGGAESLPAMANGVVSVNALGRDGKIQLDSNESGTRVTDPETTVAAAGVDMVSIGDPATGSWDGTTSVLGSSLAAPLVAGMLAAAKQKYPKATGNQLVQSLIHNTTPDDHELIRDTANGYGYGPASLTHLLAVDPGQYPDTNPLTDKAFAKPTAAQIADSATRGSTPKPTAGAGADAGDGATSAPSIGLLVGVGGGVLVVLAALIVLIVVLARRRVPRGNGGNV